MTPTFDLLQASELNLLHIFTFFCFVTPFTCLKISFKKIISDLQQFESNFLRFATTQTWQLPIQSASSSSHMCRSNQCYIKVENVGWKHLFHELVVGSEVFLAKEVFDIFFAELSHRTSTNEPEENPSFADWAKRKLLSRHQNNLPRMSSGVF